MEKNVTVMVNAFKHLMTEVNGQEFAGVMMAGQANFAMNSTQLQCKHHQDHHHHTSLQSMKCLKEPLSHLNASTSFSALKDILKDAKLQTKVAWTLILLGISKGRWEAINHLQHRPDRMITMLVCTLSMYPVIPSK